MKRTHLAHMILCVLSISPEYWGIDFLPHFTVVVHHKVLQSDPKFLLFPHLQVGNHLESCLGKITVQKVSNLLFLSN